MPGHVRVGDAIYQHCAHLQMTNKPTMSMKTNRKQKTDDAVRDARRNNFILIEKHFFNRSFFHQAELHSNFKPAILMSQRNCLELFIGLFFVFWLETTRPV